MATDPLTEDYTELLPPEGDDKVGQKVFEILKEVVNDKVNLGLDKKWLRAYELRRNKHWKQPSTTKVPLVSANLIGVHIQRTANTMTDNNPTFNVNQVGEIPEGMDEALLDLQRATEFWWQETEQQESYEESVINGETYGITIEKSVFNPDLDGGRGDVETVIVDPFYFGVYPVKWKDPKTISRSLAVLHYYPLSIREVKRKWGSKADNVKPDEEFLRDLGEERREIGSAGNTLRQTGMLVNFLNQVRNLVNFGTAEEEKNEEVLVVECWTRDYSEVNDGEPVPDMYEFGKMVQNKKMKYPGGIRLVTCCNGGNVVLGDEPNPNINPELPEEKAMMTYLWDKFPFAAANSQKDPSNGWGFSDIDQLEWLQREHNKALSQLILEKDRAARRKIINPKTSGVPNEHFTNFPGIINPSNANEAQGIRYLDYPQIPMDIQAAAQLFKDLFFLVSGSFEIDMAQTPDREVIAYKAIAALMERAATMMRGKIRSYSRLIRERGRMYLSHVMNFYTEERLISYMQDTGRNGVKRFRGSDLIMPARLTIVSGSTMPVSKIQQREEALALYRERAIDAQELLTKLDWSNRAEIVQRMNQGPLGQAANNYQSMGMPPDLVQLLLNIANVPPDKIQKLLENGTIPTYEKLVNIVGSMMSGQPMPQPEDSGSKVDEADVQVKLAQAKKIEAETMLTIEKIATERLGQEQMIAGVKFDREKLRLEKAKIIAGVETQIHKSIQINRANQGVYNESGSTANNKKE